MAGEYKIKVNNPARPKGDPLDVQPFGLVENGDSFTAILTQSEVERFQNSPVVEIEKTGRRKSDLSEEDRAAWDSAVALEKNEEAAARQDEEALDAVPVAGEESIEATEPVEAIEPEGGGN